MKITLILDDDLLMRVMPETEADQQMLKIIDDSKIENGTVSVTRGDGWQHEKIKHIDIHFKVEIQ